MSKVKKSTKEELGSYGMEGLQELVRNSSVINEFSYPFCKLLMIKLRELEKADKMYVIYDNHVKKLEVITKIIIGNLANQMKIETLSEPVDITTVRNFIEQVEEFLDIFREKFV